MDNPDLSQTAQDNLRTIRQLMERATVYRVISAMPAILTGLLAIIVAIAIAVQPEGSLAVRDFVIIWLGVYLVVDLFNCWMLHREAKQRSAPFPSPQMLHAILAMAPPMIVLGVIGFMRGWEHNDPVDCALLWVMGYGLGLAAMASFAPRSILKMGWAFIAVGIAAYLAYGWKVRGLSMDDEIKHASMIMGATFGVLHLIYGAAMLIAARRSKS